MKKFTVVFVTVVATLATISGVSGAEMSQTLVFENEDALEKAYPFKENTIFPGRSLGEEFKWEGSGFTFTPKTGGEMGLMINMIISLEPERKLGYPVYLIFIRKGDEWGLKINLTSKITKVDPSESRSGGGEGKVNRGIIAGDDSTVSNRRMSVEDNGLAIVNSNDHEARLYEESQKITGDLGDGFFMSLDDFFKEVGNGLDLPGGFTPDQAREALKGLSDGNGNPVVQDDGMILINEASAQVLQLLVQQDKRMWRLFCWVVYRALTVRHEARSNGPNKERILAYMEKQVALIENLRPHHTSARQDFSGDVQSSTVAGRDVRIGGNLNSISVTGDVIDSIIIGSIDGLKSGEKIKITKRTETFVPFTEGL